MLRGGSTVTRKESGIVVGIAVAGRGTRATLHGQNGVLDRLSRQVWRMMLPGDVLVVRIAEKTVVERAMLGVSNAEPDRWVQSEIFQKCLSL